MANLVWKTTFAFALTLTVWMTSAAVNPVHAHCIVLLADLATGATASLDQKESSR